MKSLGATLALLALLVLVSRAHAQDAPSVPWTRNVVKSAKLNEQRTILVATPDNQLRRAVDLATRTGHPVVAESRKKLEQLEHAAQAGKPKAE